MNQKRHQVSEKLDYAAFQSWQTHQWLKLSIKILWKARYSIQSANSSEWDDEWLALRPPRLDSFVQRTELLPIVIQSTRIDGNCHSRLNWTCRIWIAGLWWSLSHIALGLRLHVFTHGCRRRGYIGLSHWWQHPPAICIHPLILSSSPRVLASCTMHSRAFQKLVATAWGGRWVPTWERQAQLDISGL